MASKILSDGVGLPLVRSLKNESEMSACTANSCLSCFVRQEGVICCE